MKNVHKRAMLVSLRISLWTAQKFDRAVSREITTAKEAAQDAGRWNKHLLAKEGTFAKIHKAAGAARTDHYFHTLAWDDKGWRLLVNENYWDYTQIIRQHGEDFRQAVSDFEGEYPSLVKANEARLGKMFDPREFPPPEELSRRFGLSVAFAPLPARGDFRLELDSDQVQEIESRTEARVQGAVEDAVRDAWRRLLDAVQKIQDKLSDPDAIFRDSLIENARDLTGVMSRLNLFEDPEFDRMVERVRTDLALTDPEMLRQDKRVRRAVADEAARIAEEMALVMG